MLDVRFITKFQGWVKLPPANWITPVFSDWFAVLSFVTLSGTAPLLQFLEQSCAGCVNSKYPLNFDNPSLVHVRSGVASGKRGLRAGQRSFRAGRQGQD
jgi:hypothetical protein